jgi:iron(III) transport system ATP-binding protein
VISIKGLRKSFETGGKTATVLDGLSLDIERNSFFTLLGPSGCGKSTLLRCIAGLENPDEGEISINDVPFYSSGRRLIVPPNKRKIGMVFQSYAIWPHMTVGDNVAFPLEVQGKMPGKSEIRARALRALSLVGLDGLEDRYASKLSGGQQQRVALARAIVAEPEVLLLDEPLSNLDAALRDQMRAELLKIQRGLNVTTIYVTHDQVEALSLSDRIAIMSKGRFVEIASPNDLYYEPRTSFAARFVGGANIITGRVSGVAGGLTRVESDFGPLVTAEKADGEVELFVRPEKIMPLLPGAPPPRADNVLECSIRTRRFAGETTELDLVPTSGAGNTVLACKASSSLIGKLGDVVQVSIDPTDVHVLYKDDTIDP